MIERRTIRVEQHVDAARRTATVRSQAGRCVETVSLLHRSPAGFVMRSEPVRMEQIMIEEGVRSTVGPIQMRRTIAAAGPEPRKELGCQTAIRTGSCTST